VRELVYFTDRNLGQRFPDILEAAGMKVERHRRHFADNAPDEEWITDVAARGWVAVSHDKAISRRPNERQAVMDARLALLIVVGAAPFPELAANFVATRTRIDAFVRRHSPPFVARVYRPTPSELARKRNPVGRIEYWLPERQ
jgi:hypothetical protein